MYGCESWTIKKVECWRINAFELQYWRRLLRVPWTARSNQSILKEINPVYSLEGLMLKLKLSNLMWRANSLEKTLMLGKIEGRRRSGRQRTRWLNSIIDSMDINLSKLWEIVKDGGARRAEVYRVTKNQVWLSNWKTTTKGGRIGICWDSVPSRTQTVRQCSEWWLKIIKFQKQQRKKFLEN